MVPPVSPLTPTHSLRILPRNTRRGHRPPVSGTAYVAIRNPFLPWGIGIGLGGGGRGHPTRRGSPGGRDYAVRISPQFSAYLRIIAFPRIFFLCVSPHLRLPLNPPPPGKGRIASLATIQPAPPSLFRRAGHNHHRIAHPFQSLTPLT